MTVLHAPEGGGRVQLRWDQIRESMIGVFDLTTKSRRERASNELCRAFAVVVDLAGLNRTCGWSSAWRRPSAGRRF
jgi:hypothetical protein